MFPWHSTSSDRPSLQITPHTHTSRQAKMINSISAFSETNARTTTFNNQLLISLRGMWRHLPSLNSSSGLVSPSRPTKAEKTHSASFHGPHPTLSPLLTHPRGSHSMVFPLSSCFPFVIHPLWVHQLLRVGWAVSFLPRFLFFTFLTCSFLLVYFLGVGARRPLGSRIKYLSNR